MNEILTLGEYIKRFCKINNIKIKTFIQDTGFKVYPLNSNTKIRIQTYFRIAEYMSENSNMNIEFYLKRLKDIYQNNLYIREI